MQNFPRERTVLVSRSGWTLFERPQMFPLRRLWTKLTGLQSDMAHLFNTSSNCTV